MSTRATSLRKRLRCAFDTAMSWLQIEGSDAYPHARRRQSGAHRYLRAAQVACPAVRLVHVVLSAPHEVRAWAQQKHGGGRSREGRGGRPGAPTAPRLRVGVRARRARAPGVLPSSITMTSCVKRTCGCTSSLTSLSHRSARRGGREAVAAVEDLLDLMPPASRRSHTRNCGARSTHCSLRTPV